MSKRLFAGVLSSLMFVGVLGLSACETHDKSMEKKAMEQEAMKKDEMMKKEEMKKDEMMKKDKMK